MNNTSIRTIVISLVLFIVIAGGVIFAIRQAPSADEGAATIEEEKQFTAVNPTTIWGVVTWNDGKVASGVTITIGGVGQTTNAKGEYAVSVYQTGAIPVQFESGKDIILASDAAQAEVDVTEGGSIHRDFVITKSAN